MNMGVEIQLTGMSVQYGCKPCFSIEIFIVFSECFQHVLNTGKENCVNKLLVLPSNLS
jgi:hypothetical protein